VLAGGGLAFIAMSLMVGSQPHMMSWIDWMFLATAAAFFGLLALRWSERVEIDHESIRCVRPLGAFAVAWPEVASIEARSDALGPCEIYIVERSGKRHKLRRIYARWDRLVSAISSLGG
jgi:hypothetical protein